MGHALIANQNHLESFIVITELTVAKQSVKILNKQQKYIKQREECHQHR